MSQPLLASGPSLTLHFSLPTDKTPDVQFQHLLELGQTLQGMALFIRPSVVPATPEVPQ